MTTDPADPTQPRTPGLDKHEVPPPPDAVPVARPSEPRVSREPRESVAPMELTERTEPTEPTERMRPPNGPSFPVLPTSEHDKLAQRLRHAVSGSVDSPRGSVEAADILLDEITTILADLLVERRRTLRAAWHDDGTVISETEELRLAMRGYRNVLERLLSV